MVSEQTQDVDSKLIAVEDHFYESEHEIGEHNVEICLSYFALLVYPFGIIRLGGIDAKTDFADIVMA